VTAKTERDIAAFFRGREESLRLFNTLRQRIESKCTPKIQVTKTQISFGEVYKYLWVWLPQTWIRKRKEDSITLTIATGKKIRSKRIEESVQPKKGFWTHHVLIENSSDIDAEVERLIQASIDFYLERLSRKQAKNKRSGDWPAK
jgi:hypothetical protein